MTAPQADGADRLARATDSTLRAGTAAPGLLILLLVGLLLRLTIAYVLLPGSGFESDIGTYAAWADRLYTAGPAEFYAEGFFADYPPGYLYILWLGSHLFALLIGPDNAGPDLLKLGPIVFDILVASLLYRLVRSWTGQRIDSGRLALVAAGLYLFNPVSWYDSAVWGQTDAVGAFVILLGIGALVRGNSEGAAVAAVLAALVKPQFGIVLAPVVGMVLLRRHLLVPGSGPRHIPLIGGAIGRWLQREQGPWRLLSSAVVGLTVLIVLLAPFRLDLFGFIKLVMTAAAGYPWLSVNAYNPWALFGAGGEGPLIFSGGRWSPDTVPFLGPLPAVVIGTALLAIGFLAAAGRVAWREDRRTIVALAIFLALAFFILPTRVHERYLFPVFGLIPLLAVVDRRWLWALVALSVGAFINFHGVLTNPLYATPNLEGLPLGDFFRQPLGILTSIILGVAGFAFAAWQLRPAAVAEPDPFSEPLAMGAVAGEGGADTAELGDLERPTTQVAGPSVTDRARAWLAGVATVVPVRRDRSMLLVGESAGRLTRRDALLVVMVFLAALLLRTYRIEAPHTMHFDEVYHARTATEFLQHWRYGEPHSIYEFTHPHLAKYLMAAGLVALGNNRVTEETDLGVSVRDAVVEHRWLAEAPDRRRHGDRLFVTTGSELRAHDLATGVLEGTLAGAFEFVAVDGAAHTLFAANRDGTIWQVPTASFDAIRFAASPGGAGPPVAAEFATVSGLSGELAELAVAHGRVYAISSGGTVVALDALLGSEAARTELPEAHSLLAIPSRPQVVVDPAQLGDPTDAANLATTLAGLLARDAAELQAFIEVAVADASGPLPVAGYLGTTETVQEEIDAGNLPGVSIADGPGVALATATGIHLLDAATLAPLSVLETDVAVSGMAFVAEGAGQPTIYAATGAQLTTVRMPTDQSASIGDRIWMPGSITDVYWSESTTMVHALGQSPDGAGRTVYVVAPTANANAVFADARLGFDPAAVVLDIAPEMPNEDRLDLLAIGADGRMATIDIGGNATAYRFPGVLLGALMAACIFILARFLFARRSVAIIAALLVLADGMFFANARIAMNDAYVAFFIVAALTLFVPLWLGRWRNRAAVAAGLAGVGLLLGLALASKWVGLYAIGAVGLLILLRSALGRIIALVAMILMTGLLGYIAITPSASVESPQLNYIFLALMIGATVLLAVGIARRPVRFTMDELRLVVVLPLLAGAGVLAFGASRLATDPAAGVAEGSFAPTRLVIYGIVAIAAAAALGVAAWLAGRRGIGPLAREARVELYREPAAPPPPRGWLRPGSGLLGLPWLAALGAITLVPIAVYALSYLPWIELGNRWTETFPAGNTGQTFLDLQKSMYDYHNHLRATHAASSPWWAWPLDLKPVWFEQSSYAGPTTAVIYDSGNLVAFWLAIPAVAFVCWQAWQRRSLPLTFIAIAIASLWLPWARIDRATFQYHIFTTLPFSFMALAYFLAELWHGPSSRTWLLARAGAAVAVIGAPLLWLLRLPLCGMANTEQVNAGTEVCGPLARDLTLTDLQGLGLVLALGGLIGAGLLAYASMRGSPGSSDPPARSLLLPITLSVALLGVIIVVIGAGLPGNTLLTARVQAEQPALLALLLLAVPAYFVLRASDPRRFVVGALIAAVIWFVAFYPNFASLPVPTPLSQIHLGLLPTWNWGFQFGVNLDEPNRAPIEVGAVVLLTVAVAGLCAAAAYAARSWSSLPGGDEAAEVSGLPETS